EVRKAVLYDCTGGGYAAPPTDRLKIAMASTRASIIVDVNTSRPDVENYGLNVTYTLTEIVTGKIVVTGTTFARVSYDIPGQEQRYARRRGLRDAELRARRVVADNIGSRLASYFLAGTYDSLRRHRPPPASAAGFDPRTCSTAPRTGARCPQARGSCGHGDRMVALKGPDIDKFLARPQ